MSAPLHAFRAIWPITDPALPATDLLAAAVDDLPAVALRHGFRIVRVGPPTIIPGRFVPGSGGAAHVVVIDTKATRIRDLTGTGTAA